MRTNRTFAANCAAILASARSNFGDACQTKKICGSTRRGLAGVALATTYYNPLMLTLDVGPSATLPTIRLATRRQSFGRLWPLVARLRNFSRLPKSVWSLGYCRLAFLTLSSSHFGPERNSEVTYVEFVGIKDVDFVVGFSQIETCWRLSLVKGSRVHPPHRSRSCSPAS